MYTWDLSIKEIDEEYQFTAENEYGSYFMITAQDIGSGTHRIISLILCDCPTPYIYISDLTGNRELVLSIMKIRQIRHEIS